MPKPSDRPAVSRGYPGVRRTCSTNRANAAGPMSALEVVAIRRVTPESVAPDAVTPGAAKDNGVAADAVAVADPPIASAAASATTPAKEKNRTVRPTPSVCPAAEVFAPFIRSIIREPPRLNSDANLPLGLDGPPLGRLLGAITIGADLPRIQDLGTVFAALR